MTLGPDPSDSQVQSPPVFLERQSYRRRRLMDAAKLLPLLGVLLFSVPLLWPTRGDEGVVPVPMSVAVTYVFGIWVSLIALAVLFGVAARQARATSEDRPEPR